MRLGVANKVARITTGPITNMPIFSNCVKGRLINIAGIIVYYESTMSKNDEELAILLTSAKEQVVVGSTYKHYKGMKYVVLDVALIESTLEPGVVYQAQYGEKLKFIRPISDWLSEVEYEGSNISRFTLAE